MVSHSILRKKFPSKKKPNNKKSIASIKKAIALEYNQKRAELGFSLPTVKRGFPYYMVILIALAIVGGLVGSAIFKRKGLDLTGSKQATAIKSLNTLAVALGRYRYHVGVYPTTAEGLEQLALTRVKKPGWLGPYINAILPDPWGNKYVYENYSDDKLPVLFSKGPDGEAGSLDDIIVDTSFYNEPFRDVSWTEGWVPWHLRGIMWVENDREKEIAEHRVAVALGRSIEVEGEVPFDDGWRFSAAIEEAVETEVRLPLDWKAYASKFYSPANKAVFKRSFFVKREVEGFYVALRLAAVKGRFTAKLNGVELSVQDAGLEGYEIDMSKAIKYGSQNELEILIESPSESSASAGIIGSAKVCVINPKERVVLGSMKVRFDKVAKDEAVMIVDRLISVKEGEKSELKPMTDDYIISKPKIWSLDKPVVRKGNLMGKYVIRSLEYSSYTSVKLNGQDTRIKGVMLDMSLGILGEAFSESQAREKLYTFKDVGVNAVLFTDNKTNKAFFDLCDEIGLLAFSADDVARLKLNPSCFFAVKGEPSEKDLAYIKTLYMPEAKTFYLGPHWNWSEGDKAWIECITEADSVEFFVNGIFIGEGEKISNNCYAKDIAYEAGELKAIAKKNGVYYAESSLKTAYEPEALRFSVHSLLLKENESGIIDVFASDSLGRFIVDGNIDIEFYFESGPGEFVSCANAKGEVGKIEANGGRKAVCKLRNGRASVAIRRAEGSRIPIRIKAKAKDLRPALAILPYRF